MDENDDDGLNDETFGAASDAISGLPLFFQNTKSTLLDAFEELCLGDDNEDNNDNEDIYLERQKNEFFELSRVRDETFKGQDIDDNFLKDGNKARHPGFYEHL